MVCARRKEKSLICYLLSYSVMQTCKVDVDGVDGPGNWKCDDSCVQKRSGVKAPWKALTQWRGVLSNIRQPDQLVYGFTKGNTRDGSLEYYTCKSPYIFGSNYPLEKAAKYVLWQKNQAIMAVEKECLANEERGKANPKFFRRDPQADHSSTIPGHLDGKVAGVFINDLTSMSTVKRVNSKKLVSPGLSTDEAKWLVQCDPSGRFRAGREQIIQRVLGRFTQKDWEASKAAMATGSSSARNIQVQQGQKVCYSTPQALITLCSFFTIYHLYLTTVGARPRHGTGQHQQGTGQVSR